MSVNTASDVGQPIYVPGILQENDSKKKELVGVPLPLNYPVHLRGGHTLQLNNGTCISSTKGRKPTSAAATSRMGHCTHPTRDVPGY